MKLTQNKFFVPILFIMLINMLVWKDSVIYRSPWMGEINESGELHTWLTASTAKFVSNWLIDGGLKTGFRMYENPPSVESTGDARLLYQSYPSGCVIPTYVLAKLTRTESIHGIIKLAMYWNLFVQLVVQLCLSLIVFLFLYKTLPLLLTTILSLLPLLNYFCAAPLWFHQNVCFSDQAVLLYFGLALLIEFLRDELVERRELCGKGEQRESGTNAECQNGARNKNGDDVCGITGSIGGTAAARLIPILDVALFVVNFAGCFTDWLFYFFMFVGFVKRLFTKDFASKLSLRFFVRAFFYCLPVFLSFVLFVLQIGDLTSLKGVFLTRIGVAGSEKDITSIGKFFRITWKYLLLNYGIAGTLVLLLGIGTWMWAICFKRKTHERFIKYFTLIFVPCFFQMIVLKNHSVVHEFSGLKLEFPVAFLCAVLPALFVPKKVFDQVSCSLNVGNTTVRIPLIPFALFAVCAFVLSFTRYVPRTPDSNYKLYYFNEIMLNEATDYNSIVFSFTDEIDYKPPQRLAYSQKRVYKIDSLSDIEPFLQARNITEPYTVFLFDSTADESLLTNPNLSLYIESNEYEHAISKTPFRLYKVKNE